MATCPKCGRTISDGVSMSLSAANRQGKQTQVHCACGNTITYRQSASPSLHDQRIAAQVAHEAAMAREARLRKNRAVPRICLAVCGLLALLYAICIGMHMGMRVGIASGIGRGLGTLLWTVACVGGGYFLATRTAPIRPFTYVSLRNQFEYEVTMARLKRGLGYGILFMVAFYAAQQIIVLAPGIKSIL